jgi:hypothetical protein
MRLESDLMNFPDAYGSNYAAADEIMKKDAMQKEAAMTSLDVFFLKC